MRHVPCTLPLVLLLATVAAAEPHSAERITKAVTPYLNEDTFAVAAVTVDAGWPDAVLAALGEWQIIAKADRQQAEAAFASVKAGVEDAHSAGAREIIVVAALANLRPDAGPLFILACEKPDRPQLEKTVTHVAALASAPVVTKWQDDTLLIGSQATIDHYTKLVASQRDDLIDTLAATIGDNAHAAAVVSLGNDARRVVRELWPTQPPAYREIDGGMIADEIRHLTLSIVQAPELEAKLSLVTVSDVAAQQIKGATDRGIKQARQHLLGYPQGIVLLTGIDKAITSLTPQLQGSQLVIATTHKDPAVRSMVQMVLVPLLGQTQQAAKQNIQFNEVKQIGLALHNFESAHGSFPAAAAICDKDGKPLLSWRVAILPYIEQQALYDQFHLDEPWDSEHNLEVAKKLPEIYFSTLPENLSKQGMTTYLLPIAEGTGFGPGNPAKGAQGAAGLGGEGGGNPIAPNASPEINEIKVGGKTIYLRRGPRFQSITDGTSNTIMLANVADDYAVFWTKPVDWEVDLDNPAAKLKQEGREGAVTVWFDGHAALWKFDRPAADLRGVLTSQGGEVVEY